MENENQTEIEKKIENVENNNSEVEFVDESEALSRSEKYDAGEIQVLEGLPVLRRDPLDRIAQIGPKGNVPANLSQTQQEDILPQVAFLLDDDKDQTNRDQLDDCIADDGLFKVLHPHEVPGDVESGGNDPKGLQ